MRRGLRSDGPGTRTSARNARSVEDSVDPDHDSGEEEQAEPTKAANSPVRARRRSMMTEQEMKDAEFARQLQAKFDVSSSRATRHGDREDTSSRRRSGGREEPAPPPAGPFRLGRGSSSRGAPATPAPAPSSRHGNDRSRSSRGRRDDDDEEDGEDDGDEPIGGVRRSSRRRVAGSDEDPDGDFQDEGSNPEGSSENDEGDEEEEEDSRAGGRRLRRRDSHNSRSGGGGGGGGGGGRNRSGGSKGRDADHEVERAGSYSFRRRDATRIVDRFTPPSIEPTRRRARTPSPTPPPEPVEMVYTVNTGRPGLRPKLIEKDRVSAHADVIPLDAVQPEGGNADQDQDDNPEDRDQARQDADEAASLAEVNRLRRRQEREERELQRARPVRQRREVERYQPQPVQAQPRRPEAEWEAYFRTHRARRLRSRSPRNRSRSPSRRRKHGRSVHHGSDSTVSTDSETEFTRRRERSLNKARSLINPVNFSVDADEKGVAVTADVQPMAIDQSIGFESVGGLDHHLLALKEMVVFPLLYPEVYSRLNITPPRGVLFYGPPGTGKTLVARALANTCSQDGRRVAFFMRKGADCLSKWVGEAERQLRLLFEQAYKFQPSIIFFDEIDGLAPVRSSRQDQIHSSIVSTLLALLDGLDSRGQIIVIGATNRLDSIDPALRRPGRFDREFLFSLPSKAARRSIMDIHTRDWTPPLAPELKDEIAEASAGYCGADIKSLCTEAGLRALRRRYPQIYDSNVKLLLDPSTVSVERRDFLSALGDITPATHRSAVSPGRPLAAQLRPLLGDQLQRVIGSLFKALPQLERRETRHLLEEAEDEISHVDRFMGSYRPRVLISGKRGSGQAQIALALLHRLEEFPVYNLDLATLHADTSRNPVEIVVQTIKEAKRTLPAVLFMPHFETWWANADAVLRATFTALLEDMPASTPLALVATHQHGAGGGVDEDEADALALFDQESIVDLEAPTEEERRDFFAGVLQGMDVAPTMLRGVKRPREVLPPAPVEKTQRVVKSSELEELEAVHEDCMRELRIHIRNILDELNRERKFRVFAKPVDATEVPDYYELIKNPIDLSLIGRRCDNEHYRTLPMFLADVEQLVANALEYNPENDADQVCAKARALRDLVKSRTRKFDKDLSDVLEQVAKLRAEEGNPDAPLRDLFPAVQDTNQPAPVSLSHNQAEPRVSLRLRGVPAQMVDMLDRSKQAGGHGHGHGRRRDRRDRRREERQRVAFDEGSAAAHEENDGEEKKVKVEEEEGEHAATGDHEVTAEVDLAESMDGVVGGEGKDEAPGTPQREEDADERRLASGVPSPAKEEDGAAAAASHAEEEELDPTESVVPPSKRARLSGDAAPVGRAVVAVVVEARQAREAAEAQDDNGAGVGLGGAPVSGDTVMGEASALPDAAAAVPAAPVVELSPPIVLPPFHFDEAGLNRFLDAVVAHTHAHDVEALIRLQAQVSRVAARYAPEFDRRPMTSDLFRLIGAQP